MLGVVLCGGRSTRLPLKLFLCNNQGVQLPLAACKMLEQSGLPVVACVNENGGQLNRLLGESYKLHVDNFLGLPNLLSILSRVDSLCVLCGDNSYGSATADLIVDVSSGKVDAPSAVVARHTNQQLDGFVNGQWVGRNVSSSLKLLTPWILPTGLPVCDSVVDLLNTCNAKPLEIHDDDWCDLGSPQAVETYYGNS